MSKEVEFKVGDRTIKIRYREPEAYLPNPDNSNKGRERGVAAIDASLQSSGFHRGIVVAGDGTVVNGNHAYQSATENQVVDGWIEIETEGDLGIATKRIDWESARVPEAIKAAIADNRTNQLNFDLDLEQFAADLELLADSDIDLGATLYTDAEIQELLEGAIAGLEEPQEEDEEAIADLIDQADSGAIESRVKPGQIWALGRHRIACGDSTVEANVKALLGDRFGDVGMVWADPPYGMKLDTSYANSHIGSQKNVKKSKGYAPVAGDDRPFDPSPMIQLLDRVKEHFWWGGDYYLGYLEKTGSWLVWDKRDGMQAQWTSAEFELCWSRTPHHRQIIGHRWFGLIGTEQEDIKKRIHPTQKPVGLCEKVFEKYGKDDDLIFDPFLGSAPSIIAAQKMEGTRTVYGFELSPEYCEVICRRYEEFTGQNAKLVGNL